MNNTWVKLYRKTNDKGFMKDHLAFILFSWLLINVDKDTGKRKIGRYTVSDELGINPSTYYKVLQRLEKKWKVISITVAKEWSEVYVVNWAKYQHTQNDGGNDMVKTVEKTANESNTIQEYKNIRIQEEREEKIHLSFSYLENIPDEDVEYFVQNWDLTRSQLLRKAEQLADYCRAHNKKYKNYKSFLRGAISRDFKSRPMSTPSPEYEFDADGRARIKKMHSSMVIRDMTIPEMNYIDINERRNLLNKQLEELKN